MRRNVVAMKPRLVGCACTRACMVLCLSRKSKGTHHTASDVPTQSSHEYSKAYQRPKSMTAIALSSCFDGDVVECEFRCRNDVTGASEGSDAVADQRQDVEIR